MELCYNRVIFPGYFSNMNRNHFFVWLQGLVATMGGGGLFVVTFFDSSFLAFPFFPDAVVMELCINKPSHMPYYAAMAAFGSLCGCVLLYWVAKKGGEAFFHRHARGKAEKIKEWVDANGFLSAFVPAILPPPFPFKPFVLAEGVFQVPARTFIMAILLGRGLRYGDRRISGGALWRRDAYFFEDRMGRRSYWGLSRWFWCFTLLPTLCSTVLPRNRDCLFMAV